MKQVWKIQTAFGNLSITAKLMFSFGFMVILTILMSAEGIRASTILNGSTNVLFTQNLSGISAIKESAIFQMKCTRVLRDVVLAAGDQGEIEDQKQLLEELNSSVNEWLETARQALKDAESQSKIGEIRAELPELRASYRKVLERVSANDQAGAKSALQLANKPANRINLQIAEICRKQEAMSKQSRAECEATFLRGRKTMLTCTGLSIFLGAFLSLLTTRAIVRPLREVVATLQKASRGDLTGRLRVKSDNEIGQMSAGLNEALESTRTALQAVSETADVLGLVSNDLTKAAECMARDSERQSAGLDKTSSSLEQITVTARHNADHAREANRVTTDSRDLAERGHLVVAAAVKAMSEINESSESIAQIVSTVDDVAFQTNLLSLNASIEAARAGEHGLSFAVVAGEIRTLSNRSSESADGIRKLVKNSLRTVEKGSVAINKSGETLASMASSVKQVTDRVSLIVTASEEQSIGIEQVNAAVLEMQGLTQANAAQAAKLSSAAASLSSHTLELQTMLKRFRLTEDEAAAA